MLSHLIPLLKTEDFELKIIGFKIVLELLSAFLHPICFSAGFVIL